MAKRRTLVLNWEQRRELEAGAIMTGVLMYASAVPPC
jgi:hypothetical protein